MSRLPMKRRRHTKTIVRRAPLKISAEVRQKMPRLRPKELMWCGRCGSREFLVHVSDDGLTMVCTKCGAASDTMGTKSLKTSGFVKTLPRLKYG